MHVNRKRLCKRLLIAFPQVICWNTFPSDIQSWKSWGLGYEVTFTWLVSVLMQKRYQRNSWLSTIWSHTMKIVFSDLECGFLPNSPAPEEWKINFLWFICHLLYGFCCNSLNGLRYCVIPFMTLWQLQTAGIETRSVTALQLVGVMLDKKGHEWIFWSYDNVLNFDYSGYTSMLTYQFLYLTRPMSKI